MECLVLNHVYEPHDRISWQQALTKWVIGSAEVLEWGLEVVWSGFYETNGKVYNQILKPSVIRLIHPMKRKRGVKFSRENVFLRDKGRCAYCLTKLTRSQATLDHVTPKSHNGPTVWSNIVLACFSCNQQKKDLTPEQAGLRLQQLPFIPKTLPLQKKGLSGVNEPIPEAWKPYFY